MDGSGAAQRRHTSVRRALQGVALDEFRPDVEGLRALAVVAVVLFHVRLAAFSGGFIGVDVFFVLSGFLITRLLVRELADSGTISLSGFWARRARRLLPASCLVVVATIVAARVMLPPVALRSLAVDAIAASGFVVNFVFAHRLGDYFGSQLGDVAPSPLLHFWSLAVEEQFYLVWPSLMLLLTRRPRQYQRLMVTVIVLLGAASLVASIWLTDHHPTWAFYLLPARMVELLTGAILAMAGPVFRIVSPLGRALAAWLGVLGIAVAALRYDTGTSFPGTATLLPVLATALVIIGGGEGSAAFGPRAVLSLPPLQWIGRHSYAIYLWHWPVLVLAEARYGPLTVGQRFLAVAFAVVLSALSLWLVEDPARHSEWLAVRPQRGLLLGASLCVVLALAGAASLATQPRLDSGRLATAPQLVLTGATQTTLAAGTTKAGGAIDTADTATATTDTAAVTAGAGTVPSLVTLASADLSALVAAQQAVLTGGLAAHDVPSNLRPALDKVLDDRPAVYPDGCVAIGVDETLNACHYGAKSSSIKVVLFGDSHAAQWFPALEQAARVLGVDLIVLAKGGCPLANVDIPTATLARTCPAWRNKAIAYIASIRPALLIMTSSAHYPNSDAEWSSGFDTTLSQVASAARSILVLGDNPGATGDPAACLSAHLRSTDACATKRSRVEVEQRVMSERPVAQKYGAIYVDTTDWFCTSEACPMIIGDVLLFRDINHITTVAAEYFEPFLEAAITPILREGRPPS